MDAVILARIQFAMTIGFHFFFPPLSIGLAWLLVIVETIGWKKKSEIYEKIGMFFGKVLALTFAVGVATGIVMEFQFGTNWAEYSKFVGDIFGAPLAAEGIFAFFLESGFLGLYLFGRNKVSKGVHWFSGLMVAVGSTMSAFWILVANSWQQTPAGFTINETLGRAELTSFWDAVFNPSTMVRFWHTFDAAIISGAFMMAGISAYYLYKNRDLEFAKSAMKVAVIVGLVASLLELFPFGHEHTKQVAQTQPEKFAAIEGLYSTDHSVPLVLFAIPTDEPPELKGTIEIPGLLSWLAFGDVNAKIQGIDEFPEDEIPPLWLTFVSFHNMVVLGMYFITLMSWAAFLMWKDKLWESKRTLKIMIWSIPLPLFACQLGWITAEVGRQPWIVYKFLRTSDAISVTVPAIEILISIIMFAIIYLLLGSLYIFILRKKVLAGPEALHVSEGGL
ncbi:MAG: cytochrome ubiquinol oxidase subunit I [Bacteroidetes bacterium]|nr:cytochrome ubiquinol oxidase subunit I [Bacteroidota bacterium]